MIRAEPGTCVAVEVLVKQQVVAPVRIVLKLADTGIEAPAAIGVRVNSPIMRFASSPAMSPA
jgi:hypothetical protein